MAIQRYLAYLLRSLAISPRLSLRSLLIVPFVLQTLGTVGLVGFLSFRNGQAAVQDMASQLRQESSLRVQEHLQQYLTYPMAAVQSNAAAANLGQLSLDDIDRTRRFLWQQTRIFPTLDGVYLGDEAGRFICFCAASKGEAVERIVTSGPERQIYRLTAGGTRGELIKTDSFDPRSRPWYQKSKDKPQPVWSDIYTFSDGEIGITAAARYGASDSQTDGDGDQKPIAGVAGVDLRLEQISKFLQQLEISPNSEIFVTELSGKLIGSSVTTALSGSPSDLSQAKTERQAAVESPHPLVRATARYLQKTFGDLASIHTSQQAAFAHGGDRYFVQVMPYRNGQGLDWRIVVVVPESDFMERIHANTLTTLKLCLLALTGSTLIGLILSQALSRSIERTSQAAVAVAEGNFEQHLSGSRIREVELLSRAFNRMGQHLSQSFAALEEAKDQLKAVLDAVPGPISWIDSGSVYIGVNRYLANSWSMSQGAFIGRSVNFLDGNAQLAQFLQDFLSSPQESDSRTIEVEIQAVPRYYLIAVQKYQRGAAAVLVGIDITQRKQAEESLRIAEENYRSIFENALEGIFQSSPEGYFINVNPALAKIYGYDSPQEMLESINNITEQLYVDSARRADFIAAIERYGTVKDFEYRCYCKDGSIIWTQIDARAVRASNGKVLYYEGIVQDITERINREENLRQQLEELKIEIDHKKRAEEVATLTTSSYFQEVKQQVSVINLDDFWG
jgi:PAS domain S-box-containing protein